MQYCKAEMSQGRVMEPPGVTTAIATPEKMRKKFELHPQMPEVLLSATIGMLDLETRSRPMSELDVGRLRWPSRP